MNEQNLYVLVALMEDALMGHWAFRAADELAVARHLARNAWQYQDVFWALGISLKEADRLSPEYLLQAIRDTYRNPHRRAVLYLLNASTPVSCDEVSQPTVRVETVPVD